MKVDITVVQVPEYVIFECPNCKEDIKISYRNFCELVGEPCDWTYGRLCCVECSEPLDIDTVDWN